MPRPPPVDTPGQSASFDKYTFRKYMNNIGRVYKNQAIELIDICCVFARVVEQVFTQDAELSKVLRVCDEALSRAVEARKDSSLASDEFFQKAVRELHEYESKFHSGLLIFFSRIKNCVAEFLHSDQSRTETVKERMKRAKDRDNGKPEKRTRTENASRKVVEFHLLKSPTDTQPTIARQELTDLSKLPEILWNFCRYHDQRRLTLIQNPQFYSRLPTTSRTASWRLFTTGPTEQYQDTQPLCVLTNIPGRVFLEFGQNRRAFDNVWDTNRTLIFKGVCGKLEGEGIVGESIQLSMRRSWCHVEPLPSQPAEGDEPAEVSPGSSSQAL
ncbi:hypothetical protein BJV74DRAFT_887985 [Russula compacta]|nr:hypothetical protein BJV74DRAFT_887985 [Russula compacta]